MTPEEIAAKEAADKAAAEKAAAEKAAAEAAEKEAAEKGKKPTDAEAKLLKEVMEKKKDLKAAQDQLAQVTERLKAFDGIDPAEVKKLLAAQAEAEAAKKAAEEAKLRAEGNWDALKKQMNDAHAKELKARDDQVIALQDTTKSLNDQIADLTVGNAFGNSRFITEELTLTPGKTRALFGSHFEYKDGKVIGHNKPAGAKDRAMLVDGKGDPLPFEDAVRALIEGDADADRLIKSRLKAGAGSGTLQVGDADKSRQRTLSAREKIAAGLKEKKAA